MTEPGTSSCSSQWGPLLLDLAAGAPPARRQGSRKAGSVSVHEVLQGVGGRAMWPVKRTAPGTFVAA
jgi:hypothetical protein